MLNTLVLQSHTNPLPNPWLSDCIDSVKSWSDQNQFDYHFMEDELFEYLTPALQQKTRNHKVVATDLARLKALQQFLSQRYDRVIWCDADFLIFDPDSLTLPKSDFALGREVWVQYKSKEQDQNPSQENTQKQHPLKTFTKVHNAFMVFCQGNSFLDFYIHSAERLLNQVEPIEGRLKVPPQFIGPKLLTALHNIVQCPVMETAGMLCPLVVKDIIHGGGAALDLMKQKSSAPLAGANLCSSMVNSHQLTDSEMEAAIKNLLFSQGL